MVEIARSEADGSEPSVVQRMDLNFCTIADWRVATEFMRQQGRLADLCGSARTGILPGCEITSGETMNDTGGIAPDSSGDDLATAVREPSAPAEGDRKGNVTSPNDKDEPSTEARSKSLQDPSHPERVLISTSKLKDGTTTHTYKDGTRELLTPSGERNVSFPNGTGYHIFTDGRKLVRHPKGYEEIYDKQGNRLSVKIPDRTGGHSTYDREGRILEVKSGDGKYSVACEYSRGKLVKVSGSMGSWTRHTDSDGRVQWENQKTQKKYDGDIVLDKQGNLYQLPNDPNAERTIWKRDRIVKVGPAVEGTDARDSSKQRTRLEEEAKGYILDPAKRVQFEKDIREFQERAVKQGLSKDETAETYRQIRRLLTFPGEQPIGQDDRVVLAQQIIHTAAHPTEVDQGQHNTCNVSSVEARIYTRKPSAAAKLIADVAISGTYKTADGSTIVVDGNSLRKDLESSRSNPLSSDRNYASQIFQITAVNIHWQRQTELPGGLSIGSRADRVVAKGSLRYEQVKPVPGANPPGSTERIVDYSKSPPTLVLDNKGYPIVRPRLGGLGPLLGISNEITGMNEKDFLIENKLNSGKSTLLIGSEQELNDVLAKAKKDGRFPAIVAIHTLHEPFYSDSGAGAAGGSGAWHVVSVVEYDAAKGVVAVDNTWGEENDRLTNERRMSVAALFKAMTVPESK